ncbi:MAG: coenzyme F420-0:L-glutamate ligase [Candidatus Bipolaricaulia bacterium]
MIRILGIEGFPIIEGRCNLEQEIINCLQQASPTPHLQDGDILVIAHKIISKAEGQTVDLNSVEVGPRAREIAETTGKDPRLVEVILRESRALIRVVGEHIITEHRLGFICANAGVDRSNSGSLDRVVLLPADPDRTANQIRKAVARELGREIAVIIADTHGRAFRVGAIGTCVGIAGMAPLLHLGGSHDLFDYTMTTTIEAIADELCAAVTLVMGQCDEGIPLALIQGFSYEAEEGSFRDILMEPEQDLFR